MACFEAAKGLVVLLAASGLLSLVHKNVYGIAVLLIEHAHLNPASRCPQIFLDAAAKTSDSRILLLACGAALYGVARLVEGYGLYFQRAWAEVLAALSGAVYVPFELVGLVREPSWHGFVLLILNLAIVALMLSAMLQRRRGQICAP